MGIVSYEPGDILRETVQEVREQLGPAVETLFIERLVVGLFFTGVKLSNGAGGLCFTPLRSIPESVCCPSSARAMPSSGKLKGSPALQFTEAMLAGSALNKSIGIAALNALSMTCWKERAPATYSVKTGLDAMDEVTISDHAYAVVVGAIIPTLRVLKRGGRPFGILELNPSVLRSDEMPYYVAPDQAAEKLAQADLVILTGTTLINDTLERLLKQRKRDAKVVVMGPTASGLPGAFFRRGVHVLGGVRVNDPDRVLDVISEAGSGYHFFEKGADRIVVQALVS